MGGNLLTSRKLLGTMESGHMRFRAVTYRERPSCTISPQPYLMVLESVGGLN